MKRFISVSEAFEVINHAFTTINYMYDESFMS